MWVGFLGVHFEVGGGGGGRAREIKITLCLKLDRIMLGTWNFVRKYAHIYVVSGNIPFSTKAFFFAKNQHFFGKSVIFTQGNSVRAVSEIV